MHKQNNWFLAILPAIHCDFVYIFVEFLKKVNFEIKSVKFTMKFRYFLVFKIYRWLIQYLK